jgi:hypothetical protein
MAKSYAKIALVLFAVSGFFSSQISKAADALSLESALQNSKATSRLGHDALYLNCHQIGFGDDEILPSYENPAYDLISSEDARRLEIMRRFFEVIVSDIDFASNNEWMAVRFIRVDRARTRMEMGEYSEIQVAELEEIYQRSRQARFGSEQKQQLSRYWLAEGLGDIDDIPGELVRPDIKIKDIKLPERGSLLAMAKSDQGDKVKQRLRLLHSRFGMLQLARDAALSLGLYRDLYLDRTRSLYEMEVKADLGDAMIEQSRALKQEVMTDFCLVLTLAEIKALLGQDIWPIMEIKHEK